MELYLKVIDDIFNFSKKLKLLGILGQGEPLINLHISDVISYVKQKMLLSFWR